MKTREKILYRPPKEVRGYFPPTRFWSVNRAFRSINYTKESKLLPPDGGLDESDPLR